MLGQEPPMYFRSTTATRSPCLARARTQHYKVILLFVHCFHDGGSSSGFACQNPEDLTIARIDPDRQPHREALYPILWSWPWDYLPREAGPLRREETT
jgi:hypothetical protein